VNSDHIGYQSVWPLTSMAINTDGHGKGL